MSDYGFLLWHKTQHACATWPLAAASTIYVQRSALFKGSVRGRLRAHINESKAGKDEAA
jgi:hypothetical protein